MKALLAPGDDDDESFVLAPGDVCWFTAAGTKVFNKAHWYRGRFLLCDDLDSRGRGDRYERGLQQLFPVALRFLYGNVSYCKGWTSWVLSSSLYLHVARKQYICIEICILTRWFPASLC